MKTVLRLVWLALLGAAAFWLWTVFFPDAPTVIRRQLTMIARDASSKPNQNPLARAFNARKLADYCSTNVVVQLDVSGRIDHTFSSREELAQAVMMAGSTADGLQVQFLDVNVTLGPDKQSAVADLTLKARTSGDPEFIFQEMKFTLEKTGGHWLVTRVETVRTLS